jgi:NodT family efflux transporter outer membrane factor (OMF) lipoprotein
MKMNNYIKYQRLGLMLASLAFTACTPDLLAPQKTADNSMPEAFTYTNDSTISPLVNWKEYFADPTLVSLIDTALSHNQELNIVLQEIEISRNEVKARKGEYLPFVDLGAGAGFEKEGRYTRNGVVEANHDIKSNTEFPEPLGDYSFGVAASWEVDVWKKLRNAKKAAFNRYVASVDGKNFLVTNLIAELANSYYELLALDNQLAIVNQNITIQQNAYEIVKLQKQSARVTELAVRRFEAHVLYTKSLQFGIQQQIVEVENRINFLVGRYPQPIPRDSNAFDNLVPQVIRTGIPSDLLQNRPDIKRAEQQLEAAKLDIKVAKARFYPSLGITAGIGYRAFNPSYLISTPESMAYSLMGEMAAPLINRNAIKALYYNSSSMQIQAVYDYERTILNAYLEVQNQLSNISNLSNTYELKAMQVQALNESIDISANLFRSARADYMEVLMTQRDALEARFDLIETRMNQMTASVNIYRSLGGGWK